MVNKTKGLSEVSHVLFTLTFFLKDASLRVDLELIPLINRLLVIKSLFGESVTTVFCYITYNHLNPLICSWSLD